MITKDYDYPYNPDGTLTDAVIKDEQQTVTAANGTNFTTIVPRCAPYFRKSLVVTQVGTGKRLVEGVDYVCSYFFKDFSLQTNLFLYGGITFLDKTYSGAILLGYSTLGSEFVLNDADYLTLLANTQLDPRETDWRQVVDKPAVYPPVPHRHDAADLYGMDDVVTAIEGLATSITNTSTAFYQALNEHTASRINPHGVTKSQVGLGNVDNFATATEADLNTNANNVFMTVAMTRALISNIGGESAAAHIANLNNPHQTTKTQVGLGNVDNFATATQDQAVDGSSSTLFITPAGAKALATAITNQIIANTDTGAAGLTNHVNNHDNPHQVTAKQVGLGNVPNYPMATDDEAAAGDNAQLFVNPTQVAAIAGTAAAGLLAVHTGNTNNPHAVTKAQVGLGNVDNFVTATENLAAVGSDTQSFVTPAGVRAAINAIAPGLFTSHITNTNNPHSVTKDQVGLGNVDNFRTATTAQASSGEGTELFITPVGVKAYCDANTLSAASIDSRLASYLTSVEIATSKAELTARESDGLYMPRVLYSWDNIQAVGESALGGSLWTVGAGDRLAGPAQLVSDSVQGWIDPNIYSGLMNETLVMSSTDTGTGSIGLLIYNSIGSDGGYTRLYALRSAGTGDRKMLCILQDINGTQTVLSSTYDGLKIPSGGWASYEGDVLLNVTVTLDDDLLNITVQSTEAGSTDYTSTTKMSFDPKGTYGSLGTEYSRGVITFGIVDTAVQLNGSPQELGPIFYTPDQTVYVYDATAGSWTASTDLADNGITIPAMLYDDRTHALYSYDGVAVIQIAGQLTKITSTDTVKVSGSGTHADPYQLTVDLSAYTGDVAITGGLTATGDIHADGEVSQGTGS